MEVVQPVTDTLSQVETWPAFAKYVFDKFWPYLAVALPAFLGGWVIKRPRFLERKKEPG